MNVMLYEGDDTTKPIGRYMSPSELRIGQVVAVPGGATYRVNKLFKGKTTGGGQSYEQDTLFCTREDIIRLAIPSD